MGHPYGIREAISEQDIALAQIIELLKAYSKLYVPYTPDDHRRWHDISRAVACLHKQTLPQWLDFAEIVRDSRSTCQGGEYWVDNDDCPAD